MISANYCWVIDVEEVLDPRKAYSKYWLIVTLVPATCTRLGCSDRLIAVFNMSSRSCRTKLPYIICSSKESCEQDNIYLHLNLRSYETIN